MQTVQLVEKLKENHQSITACESFTAGLFASSLGSVPGVSSVFPGSLVTYSAQMKERIAEVPADVIEKYGVVSAQCAREMALQTRRLFETDWSVSFTGNAGPDALEGKPAGLVYFALAGPCGCEIYERQMNLPRNELREAAVSFMIDRLLEKL